MVADFFRKQPGLGAHNHAHSKPTPGAGPMHSQQDRVKVSCGSTGSAADTWEPSPGPSAVGGEVAWEETATEAKAHRSR